MGWSLSKLREIIDDDVAEIEGNRRGGNNGRNIRSLEDYTLHDVVQAAEVAKELGYRVEVVAHNGKGYWGLFREERRNP